MRIHISPAFVTHGGEYFGKRAASCGPMSPGASELHQNRRRLFARLCPGQCCSSAPQFIAPFHAETKHPPLSRSTADIPVCRDTRPACCGCAEKAEHRHHPRRRSRLRRSRVLRQPEDEDAASRPHGRGGREAHALQLPDGILRADARVADDGEVSVPLRDEPESRARRRAGRGRTASAGERNHARSTARAGGLRDGHDRQVAPRPREARVAADASRLRRIFRHPLLE